MNPAWALALSLLGTPRVSVTDGARLDAEAVERGVQARLGEDAEAWTVSIRSTADGVRFRARAPGRETVVQSIELPQGSVEERSILVASALAFALEQAPSSNGAERSRAEGEPVRPPWWVAVQGHVALGWQPLDPSGGVELEGGRWLEPGHRARAFASIGWSHARRQALRVHALEPLVGVLGGDFVERRVWVGAGIGFGATHAWALDRERATAWAFRMRVPAVAEVEVFDHIVLRGSLGIDVRTPRLRFLGADDTLRWRSVRPFAAVAFAGTFG